MDVEKVILFIAKSVDAELFWQEAASVQYIVSAWGSYL